MSVIQSTKEITPYDDLNWGKNMNTYNQNKKILKWENNSMPKYITHKMMIENDLKLNPVVIQQYSNKSKEASLQLSAQANLKHSLSQYYDNRLRYAQTFDIINLHDHLKGFENHPNYPHTQKQKPKENNQNTRVNYNILSNISLNQHSPLPFEMRTPIEESNSITKIQVKNSFLYKDYDIISNRYKDKHDEKSFIDHKTNELNSSKQLQERKEYDFINGRAYNKNLQDQYDNKGNQRKKVIIQPSLYNPVNHSVINEQKLTLLDQKDQNKILRYKVKGKAEDYYKKRAIEDDIRKEHRMKNYQSYSRYRAFDQRGYEIINHQRNFGYYRKNFNSKSDKSDWEVILKNTSDNETFSTKQIYKPLYDKSDQDNHLDQFYSNREILLKSLPKLEDQESFKRSNHISKLNYKKLNKDNKNKLNDAINSNKTNIDKKEWFNKKKVVNAGLKPH